MFIAITIDYFFWLCCWFSAPRFLSGTEKGADLVFLVDKPF